MQEQQQQQQLEAKRQLAPFQQALLQGRAELQSMVGVPIHLKDLFSEDSLCMMYDDDEDDDDSNSTPMTDDDDDSTTKTTLNDLNIDDDDSFDVKKTVKRKTLSIADMFTYGQQQIQHGWTRPVHVRMLVIVKPLCLTPDFPVRPNFDFYPYQVFRTLHPDGLQFATASLESPPPRRQPHHHVSMSELLDNTININSAILSTKRPASYWHQENKDDDSLSSRNNNKYLEKRRSFCTTTILSSSQASKPNGSAISFVGDSSCVRTSMALFYQDKDLKGWTGRLLEFDRQRMTQVKNESLCSIDVTPKPQYSRPSRITSTCSLPIHFDNPSTAVAATAGHTTTASYPPSLSKRLKRWWLTRRKKKT
ncbi:uncharacterized protein BX664DRAFT_330074 [Halteromyces radiatus]|uniref:uncharacterized protein n=1 Tax=Halteromyces radiatus TaxID=101107 RepID=UPI00221EA7B7|nr:uncharacterized protein BX664DRAFT_330074 [Halteromyces radiatus]KAI8093600.1 hypothetical protein BX664DRAFT_330074 [Halteromyces radiatus]